VEYGVNDEIFKRQNMNKLTAVKWMVDEGLAGNEFSAGHIWDGLTLWKWEDSVQKKIVRYYRKLRRVSNNTRLCYSIALSWIEDNG
jgi:hypothetical protein